MSENPSPTPSAAVAAPQTKQPAIYRDGDYLVVPQRWVDLPPGCVACGDPECGRRRYKIRKVSPAMHLLWFLGPIGWIGMLFYFSAPMARVRAGLCPFHYGKERVASIITYGLLLSCLACITIAVFLSNSVLILVFMMLAFWILIGVIIYRIRRPRLFRAIHGDRRYVWLGNVADSILNQVQDIAPRDHAGDVESVQLTPVISPQQFRAASPPAQPRRKPLLLARAASASWIAPLLAIAVLWFRAPLFAFIIALLGIVSGLAAVFVAAVFGPRRYLIPALSTFWILLLVTAIQTAREAMQRSEEESAAIHQPVEPRARVP